MLKIGITGGIGSGKTTISRIFSALGVPVYNADNRARLVMENNDEVVRKIKTLFGSLSYLDTGKLNPRHLSSSVFNNPQKLEQLNSIVHPAVGKDFSDWLKKVDFPYILKEAALLYEAKSYKELDKIIVVTCPEELRIKRTLERDPYRSREEVKSIIKRQLPEAEKESRADFLIANDEKAMVLPQVLSLHKKFMPV